MDTQIDIAEIIAGLSLFGDLSRPQLEGVAHTFDEEWFTEGQRILRQGFAGSGFYVILDGEARVRINDADRGTLRRGDYFGEISILLGENPSADVIASTPLRCMVLPGTDLKDFLTAHPTVMYRMLQAEARRLRQTSQWQN